MNTTQLKPGRELDKLVAEKMGLVVKVESDVYQYRHYFPQHHFTNNTWSKLSFYSTLLKRAWQVVEFAKSKGYVFHTVVYPGGPLFCHFSKEKTTPKQWTMGQTMPHAICLAFLDLELD